MVEGGDCGCNQARQSPPQTLLDSYRQPEPTSSQPNIDLDQISPLLLYKRMLNQPKEGMTILANNATLGDGIHSQDGGHCRRVRGLHADVPLSLRCHGCQSIFMAPDDTSRTCKPGSVPSLGC